MLSSILNKENPLFKPFKKGDRLLNKIFSTIDRKNLKFFFIFSSSKCKKLKMCTLTINMSKTPQKNIEKLENLLKMYTWNLSNNQLKTTENGIHYSFNNLLLKYNIILSYKISIDTDSHMIKQRLSKFSLLFNLIHLKNSKYTL